MTCYTALDVSLRSVSICIIDDKGDVQHEAKVAAEADQIVACLRAFGPDIACVGFEAGTLAQYLTYGLQEAGFEAIFLEARQVAAALSAMRNKTDHNDARGIAVSGSSTTVAWWMRRVAQDANTVPVRSAACASKPSTQAKAPNQARLRSAWALAM